ncbi:hypothetical protein [Nonomuraea sp. NPDC049400]|uniref:hypothetical protein n=1 Tax=Nonomuraea sp. NPDC049400 TaxID=3364352 RepID=UPI0037B6955F
MRPMLVAMIEYFQPVRISNAVRFLRWQAEGRTRRTSRMPSGQPARWFRPVSSAT